MNRVGMYAASFDPITIGHLDIISRAATLFDILVVVVAHNAKKKYSFTAAERREMVQAACNERAKRTDWRGRGQILTVENEGKLTARFAERYGLNTFGFPVQAFVRGIRNPADFQKELDEYNTTFDIDPRIEFIPLFCKPTLSHVSSSMVKGLFASEGGEKAAKRYLPPVIFERVAKRLAQPVEAE